MRTVVAMDRLNGRLERTQEDVGMSAEELIVMAFRMRYPFAVIAPEKRK